MHKYVSHPPPRRGTDQLSLIVDRQEMGVLIRGCSPIGCIPVG